MKRNGRRREFKNTESRAGRRTIGLPEQVGDALWDATEEAGPDTGSDPAEWAADPN